MSKDVARTITLNPQVFLTEMVVAVGGAAMCQRKCLQMAGSVEASSVKFLVFHE